MSFKNLNVWKLAHEVVVDIHKMTLNDLPQFEMYETGSQIRRSSKSVKSNIVEGYGRRVYKQEFIRFLVFSLASNDETIDHLETLKATGSLQNMNIYLLLYEKLDKLGKMLNKFMSSVKKQHNIDF
jgi:four helix bundle protein